MMFYFRCPMGLDRENICEFSFEHPDCTNWSYCYTMVSPWRLPLQTEMLGGMTANVVLLSPSAFHSKREFRKLMARYGWAEAVDLPLQKLHGGLKENELWVLKNRFSAGYARPVSRSLDECEYRYSYRQDSEGLWWAERLPRRTALEQ